MEILSQIKKIDQENMLQLLMTFFDQFNKAVIIGNSFKYKLDSQKINNLFFAGMGGSAIGDDIIISCLHNN